MGVTKLWELLESVAVDVDIGSLSGKVLAVDISGWIYHYIKAMGGENGENDESQNQNMHTIGVFKRLCTCLYHGIRPIVVFDGPPPSLKQDILNMRQNLRSRSDKNIRSIAEQVIHKKMQTYLLTGRLTEPVLKADLDIYKLPLAEKETMSLDNRSTEEKIDELDFELDDVTEVSPINNNDDDGLDALLGTIEVEEEEMEEDKGDAASVEGKLYKLIEAQRTYTYTHQPSNTLKRYSASEYSSVQLNKLLNKNKIKKKILGYKSKLSGTSSVQGVKVHGIASENDIKYIYHKTTEHTLINNGKTVVGSIKDEPYSLDNIEPLVHDKRDGLVEISTTPASFLKTLNKTSRIYSGDEVSDEDGDTWESFTARTIGTSHVSSNNNTNNTTNVVAKEQLIGRSYGTNRILETPITSSIKSINTTPVVNELVDTINPDSERDKKIVNIDEAYLSLLIEADDTDFEAEEDHVMEAVVDIEPAVSEKTENGTSNLKDRESSIVENWTKDAISMIVRDREAYQESLHVAERELVAKRGREEKNSRGVYSYMIDEIKELLVMMGVPYLESPSEAEAQCAYLETLELTQGTITDDSDYFLFGGKVAVRNLFSRKSTPAIYKIDRIKAKLHLGRCHLIDVALLSGSDYSKGIHGIGPVHSIEILSQFLTSTNPDGELDKLIDYNYRQGSNFSDPLKEFKAFVKACQHDIKEVKIDSVIKQRFARMCKKIVFPFDFPSEAVRQAYLSPAVSKIIQPFVWNEPDIAGLLKLAATKFKWTHETTNSLLLPAVQRFKSYKPETQRLIDEYFSLAPIQPKEIKSKRVHQTVQNKVRESKKIKEKHE